MNNNCSLAIGPLRPKGLEVTAAEKAEWVRRFRQSGLSLQKFSTQYGLRRCSLWNWTHKYSVAGSGALDKPELVSFVEVGLSAPPVVQRAWAAELSLANGNVLRLNGEVLPAVLEQLLGLC